MSELPARIPLFILDSNESTSLFITHYTKWVVDFTSFPSFEWDFCIIDSPKGEDLILDYDFLYHFDPIIHWKNRFITYEDKDYKDIIKKLAIRELVSDYSLEPQGKLLLFKDRVVIPSNHELQLDILQKCHDALLAGHTGREKILKLTKRDFYWAGISQIIKYYVSSCQQCSRNKNIHHKRFELLKPLQIPSGPWNSLSIHFITQLPLSRSFDSILVVLDRFSKMAIFIPTYSKITVSYLAQIFISHVFSKPSLPISIVSDRGYLFISSFWTQLCQQLQISRDL
ncbi:hypothetical protein O181_045083 [Austropuccinia psidii MF-1]|uniref:Integrase catalytic domain-containing protein n=1 Tax=Austropuccinia psidii MF-1 TaxID=1389203 RepID=A0A9Q3DPL2_9BASI|nr:hypothetical protein [Austropuccinia psidii MF-1]